MLSDKAIETDLKLRVLELRMRAADLELMMRDTAGLVRDPKFFYADEHTEESVEQAAMREGIAADMSDAAEVLLEVCDELVNLTRIGGPLSIANPIETMLRGD